MAEQWIEQWVEDVTTTGTWAQVVARAWADVEFQARLVADPPAVLREVGLAVPAGLAVRVQEAPGGQEAPRSGACFVLPPRPAVGDLTEEPLTALAPARICCKLSQACGYPPP